MSYYGDIRLGDTIDFRFTTRRFTTGAPFTLAGSPVISAYVGNSTTEITAGITLTVDFDGRTGLNNVRVVATSGNGFATATNIDLVITTGTVDSVSVVGEVIGSFSIEARSAVMPTTATRTLDIDANGDVTVGTMGANVINSGALASSAITEIAGGVWDEDLAAHNTPGMAGAYPPSLDARIPAALVGGRMDSNMQAAADAVLTAAKFAAGAFDAVWSVAARLLTAGTNIVLAKGTGVTGFNDLDAAGIRTAIGLTSANLTARLDQMPSDVWAYSLAGSPSPAVGSAGAYLLSASAAGDPWGTPLPGAYGAGTAGNIVGNRLDVAVSTRLATAGYTAPLDAAGVRTAVGLATANLDTQIDALPTAAENATAAWAAGTRVLTAGTNIVLAKGTGVTGFNDLSAAQVNAEADTALADYDPPTKAELDSGLAGLSIPTTAQIADKLLTRHIAGGSDVSGSEARNVTNALRALRNRQAIAAGTGTVYEEDDTTAAWTYAATTAAGNPLSEINPT